MQNIWLKYKGTPGSRMELNPVFKEINGSRAWDFGARSYPVNFRLRHGGTHF